MTTKQDRCQRAVMASDAEWERIAREAVDRFLEREGLLATLTDPGAANRWRTQGEDR